MWRCRRSRRFQKVNVAGRWLILIDNVLTSGTTLDTYARALLRTGTAHVDVLVFAWVVAPIRVTI
jgi:predicted amidophosphoribosyltransferase